MEKFQKALGELERELVEQITALRASAAEYDRNAANSWEAKRLASSVYILLHDKGQNKSLLGQTNRKAGLKLVSSKVVPPSSPGARVVRAQSTLLVSIRLTERGAEYVPWLGNHPFKQQFRWLSFSSWWEEEVFHPAASVRMSRKNLVFNMRNKDGGAHVDDTISDPDYTTFRESGGLEVRFHPKVGLSFFGDPSKGEPVENGVRSHVRQIAWEVDVSLSQIGL
jgi:hypothetical protein